MGSRMTWRFSFLLLVLSALMIGCYPTKFSLEEEREQFAEQDLQWLDACPPDISQPLTIDEIINIAMKRNLELFVKKKEYEIQEDLATKIRFALLPQLNFNLESSMRSQSTASTGKLLDAPPGTPAPLFEIGSPQHTYTWDLGFLWNVLDFGVTYFQARQQENKANIQIYEYERIKNDVIFRAVSTYWRAVAFKQALDRANILLPEMLQQTEKLNGELKDRVYLSKDQALSKLSYFYTREIQVRGFNDRNDSSDPTQGFEKEYENALIDLAALMQLPPGAKYDIFIPGEQLPYEVKLPNVNVLYDLALVNRPELYEKDLDLKIDADQVKIAMIQQFPGIQLFNTGFFDHNRFLLHNNWYTAGLRIAWNLLNTPQTIADYVIGVEMEDLDVRNRLLLSQGILTEVSIAYLLYAQNVDQYLLALKVAKANKDIADLSDKESAVGKKSKLEALQGRIDAALALNNAAKIYAELQANLEQLNEAIGIPRFFSTFHAAPELEIDKQPEELTFWPSENSRDPRIANVSIFALWNNMRSLNLGEVLARPIRQFFKLFESKNNSTENEP